MDSDELDAWLGASEGDEEDSARPAGVVPAWSTTTGRDIGADDLPVVEGRPWRRIGIAAAVVWAGIALVLISARGGDSAAEEVPLAAIPGELPAVVDASPSPASAPSPEPPGDRLSASDPPLGPRGVGQPGNVAGADLTAVLAVRALLSEDQTAERYLEWAMPVAHVTLSAEVTAVVLDAVWLVGLDGTYDRAVRGRWAVPVGNSGQLLSEPWSLGGAEEPPAEPLPPPVLRQRVEEVAAALEVTGWTNLVIQGSEPHPELPLVWRALVDGIDSTGALRTAAPVWLEEADGLRVIGADR